MKKRFLSIALLISLPLLVLKFIFAIEQVLEAEDSSRVALAASEEISYEPLQALPRPPTLNQRIVALGKELFHDKRLSADETVSCASCHDLARGGIDQKARSTGVGGLQGNINAPTVYNAALNFVQFWDGRSKTLEEQVLGPIQNPKEMGMEINKALQKIAAVPHYAEEFNFLFKAPPSAENLAVAIATFERSLLTPNAPFDRFLKGEKTAISAEVLEGYNLFKSYGCVACHQGNNIGGNMFQKFGIMGNYFADRGNVEEADFGLYNVTRKESDKHVFKVPSLRNVALTAPYFHEVSAATLDSAVRTMGKYQLGRELNNEEVHLLVEFLNSLTGEIAK